mmetsp:Transcript_145352/g.278928  ORF Transcript_145352/g.278928 Transcript_145352/m.278928 type:complete len:668 (-) Transcript_145352:23-2026(-)
MPAEEGIPEPEVGEFYIPEADARETLADERLPGTGVDEHYEQPPQLPGQPVAQAQEFSAGAAHWLTILAILVGVWWFFSRSSSSGKSTSGGSSRRGRDAGRPGPDAEELRRKRLEALGSASRAAAEAKPTPAVEQRSVEAKPTPAVEKRSVEAEPSPAVQESAVEARPSAGVEQPTVEAPPCAAVEERPAEAEPIPAVEEGAVAAGPSPAVEEQEVEPTSTPTVEAAQAEHTPAAHTTPTPATAAPCAAPEPAVANLHEQGTSMVEASPEVEGGACVADNGSSQASPAELDAFLVRVQGNLRGSSSSRSVQNLMASMTVSELIDLVAQVFEISPSEGIRIRLFFKQKELKNADAQLGEVGISAGCNLQAIFARSAVSGATAGESQATASTSSVGAPTALPSSATASASKASAATAPEDNSVPFSVRAQGTMPGGATAAHVIEGLRAWMAVTDLERHIATAFASGNGMRLRLFYMGRELKDGDATLGGSAIKAGATVQVMFAPGEPRHSATDPAPAVNSGSSATAEPAAAEGNAAEAAAPAAAGETASAPASPAEAWQALAALEQQLSRVNDESEAPAVRQAALMLKQMLTTLTHDSNPALLQVAQAMVPDIKHIWNFDPTREHLCYLLNPSGFAQDAAYASSSTSGNAGSTPSADAGAPMPGSSSTT